MSYKGCVELFFENFKTFVFYKLFKFPTFYGAVTLKKPCKVSSLAAYPLSLSCQPHGYKSVVPTKLTQATL